MNTNIDLNLFEHQRVRDWKYPLWHEWLRIQIKVWLCYHRIVLLQQIFVYVRNFVKFVFSYKHAT